MSKTLLERLQHYMCSLAEREYQHAAVDLLIRVKMNFRKTDIDKIEKLIVQKS
ncbi:MAG: hypothetical protein ACI959_000209 [Limisphaerales bacterium]|jgi:hypothetical protein